MKSKQQADEEVAARQHLIEDAMVEIDKLVDEIIDQFYPSDTGRMELLKGNIDDIFQVFGLRSKIGLTLVGFEDLIVQRCIDHGWTGTKMQHSGHILIA